MRYDVRTISHTVENSDIQHRHSFIRKREATPAGQCTNALYQL